MNQLMSASRAFVVAGLLTGFGGLAQAQAPVSKLPVRDAPKSEDVELARRKALASDPMKNLERASGEDPEKTNPPSSILASSDILCFNGLATLVPKKAILVTPKAYEANLKFQAGAKFVSWSEFYASNRSWIITVEVTRAQAEGNESVSQIQKNVIDKSRSLVVAVYSGGPISMLEAKHPVGEESKKTNKSNKL